MKTVRKTTFINKYADSGNVARSTHAERRRINERSREFRGTNQSDKIGRTTYQQGSHGLFGSSIIRSSGVDTWYPEDGSDLVDLLLTSEESPSNAATSDPVVVRSGPGSSIDPFEVARVPLNKDVVKLLRYYKEVYYSTTWMKIEAALDGKFSIDVVLRCSPEKVILESMENTSRMYCLLADTGCRVANEKDIVPWIDGLQLLQRGTAALREELRSGKSDVDTNILMDALHLYNAVNSMNHKRAAQAHLAGLKAIAAQILRKGAVVSRPIAGLLAPVDLELSCQLLRGISAETFDNSISQNMIGATAFDEFKALSP